MFKHVAFVHFDQYLETFMSSLNTISLLPQYFYYKDETRKGIGIKIRNNGDQNRIKLISNLYNKINCLKNISKSNLSIDFDRIFAFLSDGRNGKSILRTSFVETINQHNCDEMSPGYRKIELPIKYGYSSHFRDYYKGFYLDRDYSINHVHVDIEYYLFFLSIFNF